MQPPRPSGRDAVDDAVNEVVEDAAEGEPFDTGPGPSRSAFLLAYAGVVVAGLLGAALGYAYADATCRGDCTADTLIGAIVGAIVVAVGVGVVAVLVLRAMAEWRRPR